MRIKAIKEGAEVTLNNEVYSVAEELGRWLIAHWLPHIVQLRHHTGHQPVPVAGEHQGWCSVFRSLTRQHTTMITNVPSKPSSEVVLTNIT